MSCCGGFAPAETAKIIGGNYERLFEASVREVARPNVDARIECLPSCVSADNPPRYEPAIDRDLVLDFHNANYFHRQGYAGR